MAWYATKRATTVIPDGSGYNACIYHQTKICRWNADHVFLDHGGFMSVTTKTRMNQCSEEYDLGFTVFQRNGAWYVQTRKDGLTLDFKNGMKLSR